MTCSASSHRSIKSVSEVLDEEGGLAKRCQTMVHHNTPDMLRLLQRKAVVTLLLDTGRRRHVKLASCMHALFALHRDAKCTIDATWNIRKIDAWLNIPRR